MKHLITICTSILLLTSSLSRAADKYALLIGVSRYEHSEMNNPAALKFPEDDAEALGELLKSGGYEVELLLGRSATQSAIRMKLAGLSQEADSDGVILIGLFGHGVEVIAANVNGNVVKDGCFCPYDATMREALDFNGKPTFDERGTPLVEPDPERLIRLSELMRILRLARAGSRIVLADCCRTTPNAPRGRSFGASFSVQDLPENTSLLFGCSPNEQAFEHEDWGHGAFTKCLLDTIPELAAAGSVDTARLASEMRKRVPALVTSVSPHDRQTPRPFITNVVDLQLQLLPAEITNSIGMKLRLIPAGEFMMGSSDAEQQPEQRDLSNAIGQESGFQSERPQHRAGITKPFYAGVFEVTQAEYRSVMGVNPSDFSVSGQASTQVAGLNTEQFPVENVSWYDAVEFCNTLSIRENLEPFYTIDAVEREHGRIKSAVVSSANAGQANGERRSPGSTGYRLPTEAEWEYMCRAGTQTAFWFGNSLNGDKANVWGKYPYGTDSPGPYLGRPTVVGSYNANLFGLHDTHGNVEEWCEDWHQDAAYERLANAALDSQVTSGSEMRVTRGGSYGHMALNARSSARHRCPPHIRNEWGSYLGFRVVR